MTDISELVLVTCLWCNGITFLAEDGEPLHFVRLRLQKWPMVIAKPLLLCIGCMASIHTVIVLLLYGWIYNCLTTGFMKQYFLVAPCSIIFNGIFYLLRIIMEKLFFLLKNDQTFKS